MAYSNMLKNSIWQNQSKGDYRSSILGHKGDKLAIYIPIILIGLWAWLPAPLDGDTELCLENNQSVDGDTGICL